MLSLSQNTVNGGILLPLPPGCIIGRFIRRVKRFSVEVEYNGHRLWAHCNNTGAMLGLLHHGSRALLSPASRPGRKLPWTLERVEIPARGTGAPFWAGVNTQLPNRMLAAAFNAGLLDFARGYDCLRPEAARGASRLDALVTGSHAPPLWVECKNVTMVEDGVACFPDAASERARKHLRELMRIVAAGERAAMFYLVQRPDGKCFAPADFIDPEYAELFYEALQSGVECHAYNAILDCAGSALGQRLTMRPSGGFPYERRGISMR